MNSIFKALAKNSTPTMTVLALNDHHCAEAGLAEPAQNGNSGAHAIDDGALQSEKLGKLEEGCVKQARVRPVRIAAASAILCPTDGLSYAAEQYRIVRTKLVQALHKPFRLVITSPGAGDGKTITALNMAAAMALKGEGRTLLIDGDLRGARVHRLLEVPISPGLAEVLEGTCRLEKAMFAVEQLPNLHVLPAGKPESNPTELLDSSRWRALAEKAQQLFAHVIVDSPPVELVADFDLIAAVCDGVALVVRPDHTDRSLCLAAIKKLGPKLTGVLINAAPDWFLWKKSAYHRYYHYHQEHKKGEQAE
jgi:capsular exopolysaccharide synthesis family protein